MSNEPEDLFLRIPIAASLCTNHNLCTYLTVDDSFKRWIRVESSSSFVRTANTHVRHCLCTAYALGTSPKCCVAFQIFRTSSNTKLHALKFRFWRGLNAQLNESEKIWHMTDASMFLSETAPTLLSRRKLAIERQISCFQTAKRASYDRHWRRRSVAREFPAAGRAPLLPL